jgi:hypothetical protein
MKTALTRVLMPTLLALAIASRVEAQTSHMHLGPHVAYNFDAERFGIGAQFSVPIARHLEFYPSVDYFFVSPGTWMDFNADLKYRATTDGSLNWLYVGGGLNVTRVSVSGASSTDPHANLFLGAESLKGRIHPFGELRAIIGDGSTVQIAAGLNITLGQGHGR